MWESKQNKTNMTYDIVPGTQFTYLIWLEDSSKHLYVRSYVRWQGIQRWKDKDAYLKKLRIYWEDRHVNSYNIIHGALGTKNAYMPKKIWLYGWILLMVKKCRNSQPMQRYEQVWETAMRNLDLDCIIRWQYKTQEFEVCQWHNQIVFYKDHNGNFVKGELEEWTLWRGDHEWRQGKLEG